MVIEEYTTASVVARPTPSAPSPQAQALVAADQGHDAAEDDRLDQADDDVGGVGVPQHVIPGIGGVDAQQVNAYHVARANADGDGLRGQQRQGDVQGQQPRHDQIVHRMSGERAERVNLLGDAHGAQFRGDGRADPARDHQAGQHGPSSLHMEMLTTARVAVSILTLWNWK